MDVGSTSPFLTAREAAAYIRVSVNGLYIMIRRGDPIPHLRAGRQLRFRRSDLEFFMAGKTRGLTNWGPPAILPGQNERGRAK